MAAEKNTQRDKDNSQDNGRGESIGNQQQTTQTGGQSSGGSMRHDRDDSFDEDLQRSGERKSRDDQ